MNNGGGAWRHCTVYCVEDLTEWRDALRLTIRKIFVFRLMFCGRYSRFGKRIGEHLLIGGYAYRHGTEQGSLYRCREGGSSVGPWQALLETLILECKKRRGVATTMPFQPLERAIMKKIATALTVLVALEHIYILVLEMFLWTKPAGLRAFGLTPEFAQQTAVLAANQGLYNGFLAAGLILEPHATTGRHPSSRVFSLLCRGCRRVRCGDRENVDSLRSSAPGRACAGGHADRTPLVLARRLLRLARLRRTGI